LGDSPTVGAHLPDGGAGREHGVKPDEGTTETTTAGRSQSTVEDADVVYLNGRVYTVDEAQPWAEAVAVKDGVFVAVGRDAVVRGAAGRSTEVVDLEGAFVMPGIVDMHAHPFTGVDLGTGSVNLTRPGDLDAVLADVATYAAAHPDRDVILGGNWLIGGALDAHDSPDKKLLDAIVPDRPVFLLSQSGHSAWVNSAALERAGIDARFTDRGSYIFDRYPGSREPSGTVRESAMVLIMNELHYLAPEDFKDLFAKEVHRYSKYGVTAIQPAEGYPTAYEGAALLESEDRLDVRLFPAADWLTSQLRVLDDDQTTAFIDDWASYQTDQIRTHYVKIFADGAADSHTLLLKEPYADDPGNVGSMYLPLEEYRAAILDLFSRGITVHVHAMGDATIAALADIFEEAERRHRDSSALMHLGHAVSFDAVEIERLAALEHVTVNFSPMLAVPHPQLDMFLKTPLGAQRHQQIYPVRSALDAGLRVGFGSDFPSSLVPEPDQFWYMEGWVTRRLPGEPERGTVNSDEAISVEQAIRGFTLGGAEALGGGYSDEFGSIEVGKSADFVVLDRHLTDIPLSMIHETQVTRTVFRGRTVFDRAAEHNALAVTKIEVTNRELQSAVDAANLDLLVKKELPGGRCCLVHDRTIQAGAVLAPAEVNAAFSDLTARGHRFARSAQTVYWSSTDSNYWIQWAVEDDEAVLWAYDPDAGDVVEILRVRD
jgi:predicted amidohydrolase YtcJ